MTDFNVYKLTRTQDREVIEEIIRIVQEHAPITVRGIYYQYVLSPRLPFLSKDSAGSKRNYVLVQARLKRLRKIGVVPWGAVIDPSRPNYARLPADVSVRLNSGQLQPGDAGALRAAGFELQAQQAERLGQLQQDQRMADEALSSRENYEQVMQRTAQWQQMGVLQRMGHEPLTPEQIAANRRRYGVTGA